MPTPADFEALRVSMNANADQLVTIIADHEAQIAALQAQVADLQAQLDGWEGGLTAAEAQAVYDGFAAINVRLDTLTP